MAYQKNAAKSTPCIRNQQKGQSQSLRPLNVKSPKKHEKCLKNTCHEYILTHMDICLYI